MGRVERFHDSVGPPECRRTQCSRHDGAHNCPDLLQRVPDGGRSDGNFGDLATRLRRRRRAGDAAGRAGAARQTPEAPSTWADGRDRRACAHGGWHRLGPSRGDAAHARVDSRDRHRIAGRSRRSAADGVAAGLDSRVCKARTGPTCDRPFSKVAERGSRRICAGG